MNGKGGTNEVAQIFRRPVFKNGSNKLGDPPDEMPLRGI